jgi:O-antigen ligase
MTNYLLFGALSLLFIGFVKGLLVWPVDLTLVLLGVLAVTLLFHIKAMLAIAHSKSLIILGLYLAYVSIRVWPDFADVGIEKLGRLLLIGMPVFFAGCLVGQSDQARERLSKVLITSGILVSLVVTLSSAFGSFDARQSFLSGGYQMTGILIGLAFVVAVIERRPMVVGCTALGLALCGNLSGALFAGLVALTVWLLRRDIRSAVISMGVTAALIALYSLVVHPPVLFTVAASKLVGLTANIAGQYTENLPGIFTFTPDISSLTPDPRAKTEAASADRIWLYGDAVRHWYSAPLFGKGFGNLTYIIPEYAYPHNVFLELLAETGLIGFSLFLVFCLSLLAAVRVGKDTLLLCSLASFIFLLSMVSGDASSRFLWFGLGLLFAAGEKTVRGVGESQKTVKLA